MPRFAGRDIGCGLIVRSMNRSPYPVHIAKPIEGVTYIYGDRVESIIGSLRVQAMKDLRDSEVKELILTTVRKISL